MKKDIKIKFVPVTVNIEKELNDIITMYAAECKINKSGNKTTIFNNALREYLQKNGKLSGKT